MEIARQNGPMMGRTATKAIPSPRMRATSIGSLRQAADLPPLEKMLRCTDIKTSTFKGETSMGNRVRIYNRRGFTLIEILVVIAIITVLSAILFPSSGRCAGERGRRCAPVTRNRSALDFCSTPRITTILCRRRTTIPRRFAAPWSLISSRARARVRFGNVRPTILRISIFRISLELRPQQHRESFPRQRRRAAPERRGRAVG